MNELQNGVNELSHFYSLFVHSSKRDKQKVNRARTAKIKKKRGKGKEETCLYRTLPTQGYSDNIVTQITVVYEDS